MKSKVILNFELWCMTVSVAIALISQWMVAAVLLDEFFDLGQNLGIFTHYANQDKAELFYPSWRHLTVGLFCRFFSPLYDTTQCLKLTQIVSFHLTVSYVFTISFQPNSLCSLQKMRLWFFKPSICEKCNDSCLKPLLQFKAQKNSWS